MENKPWDFGGKNATRKWCWEHLHQNPRGVLVWSILTGKSSPESRVFTRFTRLDQQMYGSVKAVDIPSPHPCPERGPLIPAGSHPTR